MRQEVHLWLPKSGPQVFSPSAYDGELAEGCFSAAPLESHPPHEIEHDPLDLVYIEERTLGHVYECLVVVSARQLSDDHADSSEFCAINVRRFSIQELIDEHLTIVDEIGRMKSVKGSGAIRSRKRTWHVDSGLRAVGPAEQEEEFTVRLWLEGEPDPFEDVDLEERAIPSKASEDLDPGRRMLERAVDVVGPDLVRKVLRRRRIEDQARPIRYLAPPSPRASLERHVRFVDPEFSEGVDTDEQSHEDFHYLDGLAREWDVQWFTNRDTLSVWLNGETSRE